MTNQEIFNAAYLGLKSQGFRRSMRDSEYSDKGYTCAYNGKGGLHCAIGWVVPEEKRRMIKENALADYTLNEAGISFAFTSFVIELQQAHDQGMTPESVERNLINFATRYQLTIPE